MQVLLFFLILVMFGHALYTKQQENIWADAELLSDTEIIDYKVIDGLCQLWMKDLLIIGTLFSEFDATLRDAIVDENGSCQGQWGYRQNRSFSGGENFLDICRERDSDDINFNDSENYSLVNLNWEQVRHAMQKNNSVDLPKYPLQAQQATYYPDSRIFIHSFRHHDTDTERMIIGIGVSLPNGNCLVFEPSTIKCSGR